LVVVIFSQSKATNQAAPSQFLHKHRDVTFLLRFKLAQGRFINIDKEEIKIKLPGIQHALILSTVGDDLISSASNLQIRGTGFETEKEARDIGFKIKNSLLASCPISDIGIDAGKERARSYLGKSIKDMLLEEGIRHLDDIHGVQVFKEDEKSLSVSYSRGAGVIISKEEQVFLKELNKAYQVVDSLDENVLLACELYGAAQFENTRAQFILYVSAIEALAGEPIKKSEDEIRLVDHLLNKVDEFFNSIENGEELTVDKERFKSQLGNLKNVSISQSCFKFVEEKLGQEEAERSSPKFCVKTELVKLPT